MKIFLYLTLSIVGLFLLIFTAGFAIAALTNKKRLRNNASRLLAQLSDHEKSVVEKIWFSFQKENTNDANITATELSRLEIDHISLLFDPNNRRGDLSSGKVLDSTLWFAWLNRAKEKGFNDTAATVVAGMGLHGLEKILQIPRSLSISAKVGQKIRVKNLNIEGILSNVSGNSITLSVQESLDKINQYTLSGLTDDHIEIIQEEIDILKNIDYKELEHLVAEYKKKFTVSQALEEKDLTTEMENKLDSLRDISHEIIKLLSELFMGSGALPDQNDTITIGSLKLKLKRADPNVPVKLENETIVYNRDQSNNLRPRRLIEKEKKLERLTEEFYIKADRITHITERLPGLESFKSPSIRIIRNHLIEHPEGKNSQITYDSFGYSRLNGPYIKGLRRGDKMKHIDNGFRKNCEEFTKNLKETLKKALSQD